MKACPAFAGRQAAGRQVCKVTSYKVINTLRTLLTLLTLWTLLTLQTIYYLKYIHKDGNKV